MLQAADRCRAAGTTLFAGQPITFGVHRLPADRVLVSLQIDAARRATAVDADEFYRALAGAALAFFEQHRRLIPKGDDYTHETALAQRWLPVP